jgi:hypothetical protein
VPWRGPEYPGELPTLGYGALDWMADHLVVPDGPTAGDPMELTDEQARFILNFYVIDPRATGPAVQGRALRNARRIRRAVLSRPKGWGKSPILSGLSLLEALGEVVFDGWDAYGEPVARSWASLGFKPKVQLVAVSEDQTANTWDPLLTMARSERLLGAYDIEPLETMVNVPNGLIEYVTSAATSREGFRPVFSVLDQTETWKSTNGGVKLAAAIRRNLGKVGGSSIETPNAFVPGENSVAEKSFDAWLKQQEGRLRGDPGLLFDHREAPAETDPTDRDSLLAGLAIAYGESADVNGGWVELERILQEYWDPDTEPQDARHYYLNQVTHAADAWLSAPEWKSCADASVIVAKGEAITLGFDGSRHRNKGITDATALIGCRVRDSHLFQIAVFEQPEGPPGKDWQIPTTQALAAIDQAFSDYTVVGMYADPAKWESYITDLEAKYAAKLKVRASRDHPMHWWMTGGRALLTVRALDEFHTAVLSQQLSHDGSFAFTRHVLNARRRTSRVGVQIAKDNPDSPRKIDAAVAAVLARKARQDAIAAGVGAESDFYMSKRIR